MKSFVLLLLLTICFHSTAQSKLATSSFGFIENKGQISDQIGNPRTDILFTFQSSDLTVQLRENGFSYSVQKELLHDSAPEGDVTEIVTNRIDVNLIGSNVNPEIVRGTESKDVINFWKGGKLTADVHHYSEITFVNIYPNIDMVWHADINGPKYDFVLKPGADVNDIRMEYNGTTDLRVEAGSLFAQYDGGELKEEIPLCYELIGNGEKKTLQSEFEIMGNVVSFHFQSERNASLTAVIDPTVSRIWGTYFGNQGNDSFNKVIADSTGRLYVAGSSGSGSTSLASAGAYQTVCGGSSDGLLVMLDSSGARLYTTYFGGTGSEGFNSLAFDSNGNLVVVGQSGSSTGIVSGNAVQPIYGGGSTDGIIVVFSPTGIPLWATYFGGTAADAFFDVAIDTANNVYAGGDTRSSVGMNISGGHQVTYGGGTTDGILVKVDIAGNFVWSTYYGGTDFDEIYAMDIIADTGLVLAGRSLSTSGIATSGVFHPANSGNDDGMLVMMSLNGVRVWGTYFGSSNDETINDLSHDSANRIIFGGITNSSSGIATAGAYQTNYSAGESFVAVFTSAGAQVWTTYYGGTLWESVEAVAVDRNDNIYFGGRAFSAGAVASPGAWQTSHGSYGPVGEPGMDAFLVKFTPTGSRVWGTYYGGDTFDIGASIVVDRFDRAVMTGRTKSSNNIASPGAIQPTKALVKDAFIARFDQIIINVDSIGSPFCAGTSVPVTFQSYGYCGPTNTFRAELSNASGSFANPVTLGTITGITSGTINAFIPVNTPGGTGYRIRVFSVDRNVADADNGDNLTIYPLPTVTLQLFPALCIDNPSVQLATINPGGQPTGGTFTGTGVDASGNFDPAVAGVGTHTIYYSYTDVHNCSTQVVSTQVLVATHTPTTLSSLPSACESGGLITFTQGSPSGGIYVGPGMVSTVDFDPSVSDTGTFTITYIYITAQACWDSASQPINVFPSPPVPVITNTAGLLSTSVTGVTYQWFRNSTLIPGATNQSWQALSNGSYYLVITDANGCSATSQTLAVTGVGIEAISFGSLLVNVFPNPASDFICVNISGGGIAYVRIALYDLQGRFISQVESQFSTDGRIILPLSPELSAGTYSLELTINENSKVIKIVLE